MKSRHQATEGKGPKVPGYIVTFSDMTTLLLTFFVMLLSLAQVQDEELFHTGRESFLRSMSHLGLGIFGGRKPKPYFGNIKVKYFIGMPDKFFQGRTIDAREEGVRRIFQKMSESVKAMPSQMVGAQASFSVTNIRFPPGDATLSEGAKGFLTRFCLDLGSGAHSAPVGLYVLGLAGDEPTEREQWILSARRAQAVADFIRAALPTGLASGAPYGGVGRFPQWHVYSWGAGPGGLWVAQDSPVSERSQILIAVLRAGD